MKNLFAGALVLCFVSVAYAQSRGQSASRTDTAQCCLRGYVDASTIAKVGAHFKRSLDDGGIRGVSNEIQQCYDSAKTSLATSECMLFDIAAYSFDQGMQVAFTARGLNPLPGSTPVLTGRAFNARMQIYSNEIFGSEKAAHDYFGNAPSKIINMLSH